MKNYFIADRVSEAVNKAFESHTATRSIYRKKGGEGEITVIDFRRPDSSKYAVRYVLAGSAIYITGDIGAAVFQLTEKADVAELAKYNFSYFASKLVTSDQPDAVFLPEVFAAEIKEDLNLDVPANVRSQLVEAARQCDGNRSIWQGKVASLYGQNKLSSAIYHYAYGLWNDRCASFPLYAWFQGLRFSAEQFWLDAQ